MSRFNVVAGNAGSKMQFLAVAALCFFETGGDRYCKIDDSRALRLDNGQLVTVGLEDQCTVYAAGTVTVTPKLINADDIAPGEAYQSDGRTYLAAEGGALDITDIIVGSAPPDAAPSTPFLWHRPDAGDVRPATVTDIFGDE